MKKLVLAGILIVSAFISHAQVWFALTFDPGDTVYSNVITIDTANYHHNTWQIGAPHKSIFDSAFSAPNCIVTDTANQYGPSDTSVFVMKIPKVLPFSPGSTWLGGLHEVTFNYRLDIDSNATALIELSTDSGMHWINIRDTLPPGYSWNFDTADLSHSTAGWRQFGLTMMSWGLDTLLLRCSFYTNGVAAPHDGWIIDNILPLYWYEGVNEVLNDALIDIAPNPSDGNIFLHSEKNTNEKGTLMVFDMNGRVVARKSNIATNAAIDLQLVSGIYTVQFVNGREYCRKQLVVK